MLRFLTISLGLLCLGTTLVGPDDIPSDLGKWIDTDPPKQGSRRSGTANSDTKHEWLVSLRDDRPEARLRTAKDDVPAPLPFDFEEGTAKEGLYGKRRFSVKVEDGWIVGINAGEFGGGLWWFSPDGKERYQVAKDTRIRGLISTEAGLFALEGLAHMSTDRGRILRLTQTPAGRWQSEDFIDLKHAPEVFTKAADGSLTIATTGRLLRVVPATKEVEVLVDEAFWGGLYPNSMVITPEGVTYMGMRHGVAKVEKKKGDSSRVRWLLPNKEFDKK
jgi:hypothetical protein